MSCNQSNRYNCNQDSFRLCTVLLGPVVLAFDLKLFHACKVTVIYCTQV